MIEPFSENFVRDFYQKFEKEEVKYHPEMS
jgi:hypothetical protein